MLFTLKTLSKGTKNVTKLSKELLVYWLSFGFYLLLEMLTDWLLFWFPFYWELKVVGIVLILIPKFKISSIIYSFLNLFVTAIEKKIDYPLEKICQSIFQSIGRFFGFVLSKLIVFMLLNPYHLTKKADLVSKKKKLKVGKTQQKRNQKKVPKPSPSKEEQRTIKSFDGSQEKKDSDLVKISTPKEEKKILIDKSTSKLETTDLKTRTNVKPQQLESSFNAKKTIDQVTNDERQLTQGKKKENKKDEKEKENKTKETVNSERDLTNKEKEMEKKRDLELKNKELEENCINNLSQTKNKELHHEKIYVPSKKEQQEEKEEEKQKNVVEIEDKKDLETNISQSNNLLKSNFGEENIENPPKNQDNPQYFVTQDDLKNEAQPQQITMEQPNNSNKTHKHKEGSDKNETIFQVEAKESVEDSQEETENESLKIPEEVTEEQTKNKPLKVPVEESKEESEEDSVEKETAEESEQESEEESEEDSVEEETEEESEEETEEESEEESVEETEDESEEESEEEILEEYSGEESEEYSDDSERDSELESEGSEEESEEESTMETEDKTDNISENESEDESEEGFSVFSNHGQTQSSSEKFNKKHTKRNFVNKIITTKKKTKLISQKGDHLSNKNKKNKQQGLLNSSKQNDKELSSNYENLDPNIIPDQNLNQNEIKKQSKNIIKNFYKNGKKYKIVYTTLHKYQENYN
ncbi:receptor expression-enhancing protein [Anaeramoeba flamelloides]|uniref:Receptor expression-enhancing protein n=1 Tax=Anaeramoeba flamelloides TaxID=1746091 RepID=A0ABQ8XNZ7_9EUKA|nr:receptor expression-enhancing protein [Anaeramoeba flamelloides]